MYIKQYEYCHISKRMSIINESHVQCIVDKIATTMYRINDLSRQHAFLKSIQEAAEEKSEAVDMEILDEITMLSQDIYDLDEKVFQYFKFLERARAIFDKHGMEWNANLSDVERAAAARVV